MKRTFLFSMISAAAVIASCGGKVLVDGLGPNLPEGTGGAGGAGGAGGVMTSGINADVAVATAASTGPGQASSGTGPPCNPNYHCAEAITPPNGNPQLLCPGSMSSNLYQALLKCTCGGPCAASCAGSLCIGQPASGSCIMCEQEPVKGCGKALQACANDL